MGTSQTLALLLTIRLNSQIKINPIHHHQHVQITFDGSTMTYGLGEKQESPKQWWCQAKTMQIFDWWSWMGEPTLKRIESHFKAETHLHYGGFYKCYVGTLEKYLIWTWCSIVVTVQLLTQNPIDFLMPLLLHLCSDTVEITRVWILFFQIGHSGDGIVTPNLLSLLAIFIWYHL